MKLAEALILRADSKKRFEQLRQRLFENIRIQEGDEPAEKPEALLKQIEVVADEFETLIKRINKTNSETEFSKGKTLTDAIAERDVLSMRANFYRGIASNAMENDYRYGHSEIKIVRTIDVAKIQKLADKLAQQYRELDSKIQQINWKTDLVE
ncbi:MAG: DIP1984 family protein [Acidobacteriota bacterium]|nr:DIP1984 family protein [Acidobacteriota bacterium]